MPEPPAHVTQLDAVSVCPLSVEEIVAQLDDAQEAPPVDAIAAARQRRDEITPRLIEILQEATTKARAGELREGDAHWTGLYLLAEFRATEALPAVLEAVSLPGELPFDLFGDLITEDLARILISLEIDVATLSSLIRDGRLNLYVRWQAADAILALVLDGQLPRPEGVQCLRHHLRSELDGRKDVSMIGGLIINLSLMWPVEAQPDIKEAFDRQLVDPFDVQWREVEQDLAEGEEGMRRRAIDRRPTRVTDAVEELQAWHFGPESQSADDDLMSRIGLMEDEDALDDDLALDDSPPYQRLEPLQAESRIGRNEACPCGSGKKYKKCCGRPAAR